MATAKPIKWTDEEKEALATETARLIHSGEVERKTPALVQAMESVLPAARRRSPEGIMTKVSPWLDPLLAKATKAIAHATKPVEVNAAPGRKGDWSTTRKDGQRKVVWKPAEQFILARAAAKAQHEGRAGSNLQALLLAQLELPEDRRRPLHSTTGMNWLAPELKRELTKLRRAETLGERTHHVTNGHDHTAPHPPIAHAPNPTHTEPVAAPLTPILDAGLSVSLTGVRVALVDAFAGIFREALVKAIGSLSLPQLPEVSSAAPRHDPRPTNAAARVILPSVLIAGLKGAQKEVIKAEFGAALDLRFYGADESKELLKTMTGVAEHSVAVTDFLSHSHTDIMKSRSLHYLPTGGGINTLRDALRGLLPTTH